MKPLNLIHWIFSRLGLLLLVLACVCVLASIRLLESRFDAIEVAMVRQQLARIEVVLRQELAAIESQARAHAHLDSSFEYVRDRDDHYFNSTFSSDIAGNLDLDWIVLTGINGETFTSVDLKHVASMRALEPTSLGAIMRMESASFRGINKPHASTLEWIDAQPTLVGRSSITDSAGRLPANGWLLVGRAIDDDTLDRLQRAADVMFTIAPAVPNDPARVVRGSANHWLGSSGIGNLPIKVMLTAAPALGSQRHATAVMLASTAGVLSLIALAGVGLMLRQRVTGRLQHFSTLAGQRRHGGDVALRWPVHGADEIDGLGLALNDLVDEIALQQGSLRYVAEHDALTGLRNRHCLMEKIGETVTARSGAPFSASLVLIDIDGFKLVNDGLGHAAGDRVLCEFGARIARMIGPDDIGSRLSADEFAILLVASDTTRACMFCENLRHELHAPVLFEGRSIALGVSMGVAALTPQLTSHNWLRNADLAMYEAKRIGENRAVVFVEALQDNAARSLELGQALRKVIDARALEVWFQPIVDGRNGVVVGTESLVRWKHDGDYVSPTRFVQIAEETGLIVRLGQFVIAATCAMLHRLRQQHPNLRSHVNLSVRQFIEGDLERDIVAAIEAYGLPPAALGLEITETQVASHESEVLPKMNALVARGFSFSLDDFGTGYSSLDRLRLLPIHTLKIDRSFVKPLDSADDVMVRNIINLSHDIGLQTIAEGVESEHEATRLIAMGCPVMQGFLLARPMSEGELAIWLEHRVVR